MNRRYVYLLLALLLTLLIVFLSVKLYSCQKDVNTGKATFAKLDSVYKHAIRLCAEGKIGKASKTLEIVANEAPRDYENRPESMRKLKDLYEKENELLKARDVLKKLVYEYPDSPDVVGLQKELEDLNMKILLSPIPTEESLMYVIEPGDSVAKIARKTGTTVELIKLSNNLESDLIMPGKKIKIWQGNFSILVDISQNALILKSDGEILKKYTVSTGADNSTPIGTFKIEEKLVSPPWYKVGAVVPPDSQEYELGSRWMGLSVAGYGIHGTSDESTIGRHITKGCVRMRNADVEELYAIVPSGTAVEIIE